MPSMPMASSASFTSSILNGCTIASIFIISYLRWALLFGAEESHQSEQHGRLILGRACVLLEEGLIGPVVAELEAGHQPAAHLVLTREGDFLDGLGGPGAE